MKTDFKGLDGMTYEVETTVRPYCYIDGNKYYLEIYH